MKNAGPGFDHGPSMMDVPDSDKLRQTLSVPISHVSSIIADRMARIYLKLHSYWLRP